MNQSPIATAADYADAMLIARRVKGVLVLLLLVMLLLQMAVFFMVRYDVIRVKAEALPAASTQPATAAGTAGPAVVLKTGNEPKAEVVQAVQYVTALIDFAGVVCAVLLVATLLLLVQIMLVGRLIGLSHVMAALVGALLAAVLLFPWQAFLDNAGLTAAAAPFKIPGVLYTWNELFQHADFVGEWSSFAFLKWARFVGFPGVSLVLLLWVHLRAGRGLRLALGEDEPAVPGAGLQE